MYSNAVRVYCDIVQHVNLIYMYLSIPDFLLFKLFIKPNNKQETYTNDKWLYDHYPADKLFLTKICLQSRLKNT